MREAAREATKEAASPLETVSDLGKALKARGGTGSPGTETLRVAVEKKTVYSKFLESVVRRAEGEYSDVMGLMVRCQGLLISRWVRWRMRGILTEPLLQKQLERSSSIIDGAN